MEPLVCQGIVFPEHGEILSERVRASLKAGRYESKEATEVKKLLKEGDRVLELGGGLGFISTICAQSGKCASITSFEADPRLCEYIAETHRKNGVCSVEVRHAVVSVDPHAKPATFYIRKNFWGSSLFCGGGDVVGQVQVPVASFNAVIEELQPTFIICDIEGGELEVFLHANLSGVTRVLMEIHSRVLGRRGIKRLFDVMSARDFHYDEFHSHGSVVLFSHVDRRG